ncbi:MAG: ABC transporter ATP-binding protein [Bryobacterales bacterium]|nr:ABC transporter ATP-binding protein [Bryobacterales bacterium]
MRLAWRTLSPLLWKHRRGLGVGLAALLLKDLFGALLPLAIKAGVDSLTQGFALTKLLWFTAAMLGLSAVKGLFQYVMRVRVIGVSRDIEYEMRQDLFTHLMRLDAGFFARYRTGDIMARATNDLNAVRMMLGPGVMYWIETSITFLLAAAIMAYVDWRLTLVALLPAPIVSLAVIWFGRQIHMRFERIQSLFSDISSRVQENLAGVRVVRAYVQEESELRQFERLNQDYIRQNMKLVLTSGMFMPMLETLIGMALLIVLWVGGARLLEGKMTLGSFLMFNVYMGMLAWPMIALGWVVNLMQRGTASLERLQALRDEQPTIHAPALPTPIPAQVQQGIAFRNVTVRYGARTALAAVDLTIPAGATIAIVGHTGSGKSTLVQLIPRMLDPAEGAVTLDGIDLRQFDPLALRSLIGFVPQETFLFSATLGENIAFGVPAATDDQIRTAAQLAGLGPDLDGFPDGLQTVVGERGITLSGGQKQRTAIARALLRHPAILILDDALSSVDTVTEESILQNLAAIMAGRTTILISHRVSTVRMADRIFVIEDGRLAEQGAHDELVALGGYYADLHQRQLLEEELESI